MGSLVRLSPVGLESAAELMVSGLTNCTMVMQVAAFALVWELRQQIGANIQAAVDWVKGMTSEGPEQQLELNPPASTPTPVAELSTTTTTTNDSTHMLVFTELQTKASAIKEKVTNFCEEMQALLHQIMRVLDALRRRAADSNAIDDLAPKASLAKAYNEKNTKMGSDCIEYITNACELGIGDLLPPNSATATMHIALINFCKIHLQYKEPGFHFLLCENFDGADATDDSGNLDTILEGFMKYVGEGLYNRHGMMKVSDCVSTITARAVDITIVHENVITTCVVDHILPYLVKAPELKQLCSEPLVLNSTDSTPPTTTSPSATWRSSAMSQGCKPSKSQESSVTAPASNPTSPCSTSASSA